MDISKKAVNETATIELREADGEPMLSDKIDEKTGEPAPCSITIYGPGSVQHQRATGKRNRAVMAFVRSSANKKMKDNEQREMDAEFLADITVSLNNFDYNGASDRAAIKALYMDVSVGYVAEQINSAQSNWALFTKASNPT